MSLDLVDMSDNQYSLTMLGNEVCESLSLIETAVKVRHVLDTTNFLEMLER